MKRLPKTTHFKDAKGKEVHCAACHEGEGDVVEGSFWYRKVKCCCCYQRFLAKAEGKIPAWVE